MLEETPASSLAHKISFAVFRVVRLTRNKKLREELEIASIELVRDLTEDRVGTLDRLVTLSEAVGEMNEVNSGVLRRELRNLYEIVSKEREERTMRQEEVSFGDIFKKEVDKKKGRRTFQLDNHSVSASAKERHSAILEFIRQFPGDCRMKHLSERFSDVSERTLRTDVGILIESGKLERLGGRSGPSSYFVAVDKAVDRESRADADALPDRILLPESTRF